MQIKKVYGMYFRPTQNTKKIVETICSTLNIESEYIDLTNPSIRKQTHTFTSEDLVVVGVPTYAGRIPNKIVDDLKQNLMGNQTFLIGLVTYGNRNYDSSLAELVSILENQNFYTIAACAIVCEHAFTNRLATHRPNEEDLNTIASFARKVQSKMDAYKFHEEKTNVQVEPYYIPLRQDGSPARFLKAKPKTDLTICTDCKKCAQVCPMQSIDWKDVSLVSGICIKCQACIQVCDVHAKYFDDEDFLSHVKMLEENYSMHKENQFWMR